MSGSVIERRATLTAVLADPADATAGRLQALSGGADGLEICADVVGDLDPRWLRRHFTGTLTYSLRSPGRGGQSDGGPAERQERLLRAAAHYDLVDLEGAQDLRPELLAAIPPGQRRISWHGPAAGLAGLGERARSMLSTPAALYVVAPQAATAEAVLEPVALLTELGRADVTAYATGPAGTWSRVLAPWLGAPVVFGRVGEAGADGMPSVDRLVADYGLPQLPAISCLFGIVGGSPQRSSSPRLHNAAYRALQLPALYLPFPVDEDGLPRFWRAMTGAALKAAGLPLRGVTVVAPHKEDALELADVAGPLARRCGAANVLWHEGGLCRADTTDTVGVLRSLARAGVDPGGHSVAVVGCGGAGRAAAAVLQQAGAEVTLVNRGRERGHDTSRMLGLPYVPLHRFSPQGHGVLVHATPLMERAPFPVADTRPDAVVLEMAYRASPTPLMAATRARGMRCIDGWQVLQVEVREQFRLMTGQAMPVLPWEALKRRSQAPDRSPLN